MTDTRCRRANLRARFSLPVPAPSRRARPPKSSLLNRLGRSHRAKIGKSRLQLCIDLMREVLRLPETHRIGIVPGSDTGAFEMAMWTMLGARGVTALAWESFGEGWVTDAVKQLHLEPTVMRADYGQLPDLDKVDWSDDVLFTWNGTTSGVRVPDGEWIPADREGLSLRRRDQRGLRLRHSVGQDRRRHLLLAESAGRRGRARRADPRPPRGRSGWRNIPPPGRCPRCSAWSPRASSAEGVFKGETINTPSMLAVEDAIFALEWAKSIGGLEGLQGALHRQFGCAGQDRRRSGTGWASGRRSRHPFEDLGLPDGRGRRRGLHQGLRRSAREGRRGLRHRRLPRCPAGPAHLVRRDGRYRRYRSARAVARLGLRDHQSRLIPSLSLQGRGTAAEGGRERGRTGKRPLPRSLRSHFPLP